MSPCKECGRFRKLEKAGNQIVPWGLQKEAAQWDLCWTSNFQNCDIINWSCFKPLSWW